MIKSSVVFLATIFFVFAQNYDPNTGEPIQQRKFDPNTGEEIEQKFDPNTGKSLEIKKEGISAKVILNGGDIVEGRLLSQDKEKIMVESQMLGTVTIQRSDIKSMSLRGVPISTRRAKFPPAVSKTTTKKSIINSKSADFGMNKLNKIKYSAKLEAVADNSQQTNYILGTGACLLIPFISLPAMSLGIIGNIGVKEPDMKRYEDLDLESKKIYRKQYYKEIRRLRTKQCFTPTILLGTSFFGLIMLGG
jgi:hypothetical protein